MKKTQEQVFLEVKEKLDYYRLPTIFPYQAVDLLLQLLTMLDTHTKKPPSSSPSSSQNPSTQPQPQPQLLSSLRHQISLTTKQNNTLHLQLLSAKQQIQALKHSNDKFLIQRSGGSKEIVMLVQAQRKREEELFEELTRVKFQYNQLMDLVHGDDEIQRRYIKRLMKFKKMDLGDKKLPEMPISQIKKGPHQTVTELQAKIILLQHKIANRESQILRLHKKTQYDGLNMNKILKDFQTNQTDTKIAALEQQVNYLEEENKKMKEEVNGVRKNGGSKEALREEVRKNHQVIGRLQKENKELRKKLKMKDFDVGAYEREGGREINKAKNQSKENREAVEVASNTINDLKKQVDFFKRELDTAKAAIQKQKRNNSQLQVQVDKFQNIEAGEKILSQYEVQSLKQKVQQYESQLQNKRQRLAQLKAENDYHKQQDRLKNEAIQNLQKIVDELMKRTQSTQSHPQLSSPNLQNTIALRKNLAQTKQQLIACQNERQKLQHELSTLILRFDQKSKENHNLNDQLNRLKIRVIQMKGNQEQFGVLQREVAGLQSDLKKEQNFRSRIDQLHQEAENDKGRLRKELQEVTQEFEIYQRKSKNHMNTLKMQVNELEENNQMLQLITKQKDKKILILQSQTEQLSGKIKLLKQQLASCEDQKLSAIRQKHKYQKRCEQLLRVNHETTTLNKKQQQLRSGSLHQEILDYQHEIKKLQERIHVQKQEIQRLNSYCEAVKISQEGLLQEKAGLRRELDRLKGGRRDGYSSESAEEEE